MSPIESVFVPALVSSGIALAGGAIKEIVDHARRRRETAERAQLDDIREQAIVEKAKIEAAGQHDKIINERYGQLFRGYDTRIQTLEKEVGELKTALRAEREQRGQADAEAGAARLRADEAERRVLMLTSELELVKRELSERRALNEEQKRRIIGLERQIRDLKGRVAQMRPELKAKGQTGVSPLAGASLTPAPLPRRGEG